MSFLSEWHVAPIYRSPFRKEFPACTRQPEPRRAMLCPSDWPGQMVLPIIVMVRGPLELSPGTAGACRQQPALPFLPLRSVPSPSQLQAQAQSFARAELQRQRQDRGERSIQNYLKILSGQWPTNAASKARKGPGVDGGHGMHHCRPSIRRALLHIRRRPHRGPFWHKSTRTVVRNPLTSISLQLHSARRVVSVL